MFETCKYCGNKIGVVNKTHNLVECVNCFLIFSQKTYSQDEIQEVYDHLYNDENPQYKRHSIVEFEQLKKGKIQVGYNKSRLINKYLNNNSKVLEIGSGIGLMGCFIKRNIPKCSYTGVEIDKKVNEKAKSFGLDVHLGDFTIIENFDREYDVVMMWEVLEHIQDLKKCLSIINNKLVKGGVFIFSVPNYDKRFNYNSPKDKLFTSGPPIHLNFFRKKSIYKIFNSEDFEILDFRRKKLPYLNLKSLYKMFFKVVRRKFEGPTLYCVIRKR